MGAVAGYVTGQPVNISSSCVSSTIIGLQYLGLLGRTQASNISLQGSVLFINSSGTSSVGALEGWMAAGNAFVVQNVSCSSLLLGTTSVGFVGQTLSLLIIANLSL